MKIAVIDGRGGKLGAALVAGVLERHPQVELIAIGLNAVATEQMRRAGARQVATGENPVVVACRKTDVMLCSLELAVPDSMLGEVTPTIAAAVAHSEAKKILVPMHLENIEVAGVSNVTASMLIEDALSRIPLEVAR